MAILVRPLRMETTMACVSQGGSEGQVIGDATFHEQQVSWQSGSGMEGAHMSLSDKERMSLRGRVT